MINLHFKNKEELNTHSKNLINSMVDDDGRVRSLEKIRLAISIYLSQIELTIKKSDDFAHMVLRKIRHCLIATIFTITLIMASMMPFEEYYLVLIYGVTLVFVGRFLELMVNICFFRLHILVVTGFLQMSALCMAVTFNCIDANYDMLEIIKNDPHANEYDNTSMELYLNNVILFNSLDALGAIFWRSTKLPHNTQGKITQNLKAYIDELASNRSNTVYSDEMFREATHGRKFG